MTASQRKALYDLIDDLTTLSILDRCGRYERHMRNILKIDLVHPLTWRKMRKN